ncbi:N-acetylmuramoyl-L-alanine amidase family protein, partial [Clostridium botulinum]|nr:N-acetylmuramoyl-L-alanine amidase family protein [Clostridium botulinum]
MYLHFSFDFSCIILLLTPTTVFLNEGIYIFSSAESDGTKGKMKIGWINDNGTWYYLDNNGAMAHDTYRNGYYLGS